MLEGGGTLDSVTVAFETWGTLNASRKNAVLVLHALTGDSHASGTSGPAHIAPGWWDGIIGPGLAIDTNRFFVVCPNVLGGCQGTTGPSSLADDGKPFGSRFPDITIRDQVAVEIALANQLDIDAWHAVVGGSMGGMRALEWAVSYPTRLERAVVIAVGAAATADQIALCSLQVRSIENDPHFFQGDYYSTGETPLKGMSIARGLGQFSYRTATEFETRFGRLAQDNADVLRGGTYAIESYLAHHGNKLGSRFDPNSYVVLNEAMNSHDIGRGRGGVEAALTSVSIPVAVAGVTNDRLYPISLQQELADFLPNTSGLSVITSSFGHDGFLLEIHQVGALISSALDH
jgi:homoserine O-acetyltransferase